MTDRTAPPTALHAVARALELRRAEMQAEVAEALAMALEEAGRTRTTDGRTTAEIITGHRTRPG